MGVVIHSHCNARVTHDVLKRLRIHARLRHSSTERVTQNMRRDVRQLFTVQLIVFTC